MGREAVRLEIARSRNLHTQLRRRVLHWRAWWRADAILRYRYVPPSTGMAASAQGSARACEQVLAVSEVYAHAYTGASP